MEQTQFVQRKETTFFAWKTRFVTVKAC